jgi:hypothetical protein
MGGMNLSDLPAPPSAIDECLKLYARRLERGVIPFPRACQLMIAYMAWPNDRRNRDRWMATSLAFFVAEESRQPAVGTTTATFGSTSQSRDQVGFELFGGLLTVAEASLSHMMKKLESIQKRWPRVADVLQTVVDIHHEKRASISGGASISKALDVLLGAHSRAKQATAACRHATSRTGYLMTLSETNISP